MPENLEIGDWLCIGGIGAYSQTCFNQFNQMRTLTKVIVMDIPREPENDK